jgi:hypothetical protein
VAASASGTPHAGQTPSATAAATTAQATASALAATPLAVGSGVIHGSVFIDANADGVAGDGEVGLTNAQVTLNPVSGGGLARWALTGDDATFSFDGLAPGVYHVGLTLPDDYVATTDAGQDVEVTDGAEPSEVAFGVLGVDPQSIADAAAAADDEQIMALASVSSLPLRFAEGRDLMAQVQRRVLGDGLVWLGVPFRSQIDGGDFQYVNCGPASLTMVLAAFGLEVGPSQVRDYLNNLIDNFNTDQGTSLDTLAQIGKSAGLTPMDLYSDTGGYRNWSTDAVRWHLQQGHPVLTLVKYRNLPGHSKSLSEFDHYIVISGLTPNGFIYNDAAFATTLGYGLEISDVELEYAWNNSSIPHHALALGLDPDRKALSFPELPRARRPLADSAPMAARGARRLAESDEAERAPLVLTPTLPVSPTVPAVTAFGGPLLTASDRWQDDPNFQSVDEPGSPMGLNMEQSEQPALEARPGPGAMVPKLLSLLGLAWLLWLVWLVSGRMSYRLARWRPSLAPLRAVLRR